MGNQKVFQYICQSFSFMRRMLLNNNLPIGDLRMYRYLNVVYGFIFLCLLAYSIPGSPWQILVQPSQAYKFFTDSVSPRCHFAAVPCESYDKFIAGHCFPCSSQMPCGNMGYYADRSSGRDSLYLITQDEEPFCAHQLLLRAESSPSPLPVVSYGKIQVTLLGNSPNANETFVMTRKDDEELQAGGVLARIVVPHPVMEDGPVKVELLYTAYSGWISSGLAKWSIDKISLGDSFGKSLI
ncbi:uncharacterized protein LOC124153560 isoform X2 [Ischnura elegans]|uniref:uncharacterized protein LOC124153560 isoform X2 n=1 Tax=Ischnura elegans TaxID=197161 RepID=UPI001ED8683A|nr:uncharacterized protein LOC124153560 isoform X2 [Ischnura elegans]